MSGSHPAQSQSQVERRMSALNMTGSALAPQETLGGWGTFSASSLLSVAELDAIVNGMKAAQAGGPITEQIEATLKKHCFQLAKVLSDAEVSQRFSSLGGLNTLCFALGVLKGSSLSYAVNALRTFSHHESAMDSIVQSFQVQSQLWHLLKTNVGNVSVLKSLLNLLTEIVQRTSNGFSFVISLHFQNGNGFFPLLVSSCLSKSAGLDVQIATIKLINALLTTAKDAKQFHAVLDELSSSSGVIGVGQQSFSDSLDTLKEDPSPALKDELQSLRNIQKTGFKAAEVSGLQRKEIQQLKTQVADISQLATEYRSTTARLENELKNFKRREPLVQLLWAEIQQLRGALNVATAAGFVYDLSDPSSRYVKPSAFAYIDRLDVSRWAGQPGSHVSTTQGDGLGQSGTGSNTSQSHGGAPSTTGQAKKAVAGMRSGDDAEALADTLVQGFSSPLAPNAPGTISYDIPPPPSELPPEDMPTYTPASVSSIPSAPGAPPMAPSAPGAPPMAPGAPSAPGPPRAPVGPQPTKKAIKPLRKMKPLHWNRILLPVGSDQSMWTTVGKRLDELEQKIPLTEIDALFAEQSKTTTGKGGAGDEKDAKSNTSSTGGTSSAAASAGGSSSSSTKKENTRILSDKRFNAVAIMLSFLPPTDQVIQAIQNLDLTLLDKDQVGALHKQMPTEEEVQLILTSGCQPSELAKPEQFLSILSQSIPCVNSRIDCWHFANSFKECIEDLRTPFEIISAATTAVRQSKCLPILCSVILHTGNFINGSTPRGQADGFDLSVLSRLHMIKDSQGGTMLNFVVSKVLDMEGLEFGNKFVSELSPCRGASEFPLRPALAAATRFQGLIKTQKNLAALVVAGTENSMDPFTGYMAAFSRESEDEGNKLKHMGQITNDSFNQLLFYLNPSMDATTAAKTASEELFQILYEFAEGVKAMTDQRKQVIEAAVAQKKQEEIRQRQIAARAKAAEEKTTATTK